MSVQRLTIDGYGQLELNNAAFRRDGRVEAQCRLDETDFASVVAENGMILAIDNVTRTVTLPEADGSDQLLALNYSAEHLYNDAFKGLKNFKLGVNDFLPRLGYLAVGDKFTTNCISYDTSDFADDATLKANVLSTTAIYGSESTDGSILLKKGSAASSKGITLKAIAMTTMPDGQFGMKFQVIAC